MRSTRITIGFAAGALLLSSACSSSSNNTAKNTPSSTPTTPIAQAATYEVGVDGNAASLALPVTESELSYFPKAVSVHPGDTVSFGLNDSGEPHTVALGTLVNAAAAAAKTVKPHADPPPAVQAALKKVPDLLPQGPGDAIQAAAQPCFQATGPAPLVNPCTVKTGEFTGSESLVTSGWLDPNAPFVLKISDAATPGVYNFYCQLHGPDMGGTLTIADKTTSIPSVDEVKATGATELAAAAKLLEPGVAQLSAGTPAKAIAGTGVEASQAGLIDGFGPKAITIPVGGKVTWAVFGPHSIYFNAPADAQQLRAPAPDGAVHLNAKAATPVGGPGAGPKPGLINGGSWDGTGTRSSGIILSFPPQLSSYRLKFTKAGTFKFQCTIHKEMKGTVTVA